MASCLMGHLNARSRKLSLKSELPTFVPQSVPLSIESPASRWKLPVLRLAVLAHSDQLLLYHKLAIPNTCSHAKITLIHAWQHDKKQLYLKSFFHHHHLERRVTAFTCLWLANVYREITHTGVATPGSVKFCVVTHSLHPLPCPHSCTGVRSSSED